MGSIDLPATTDGTGWIGTPSDLYVASAAMGLRDEEAQAGSCPRPPTTGDFLLALDGMAGLSQFEVEDALQRRRLQESVRLRLYHTADGDVSTCNLPPNEAAEIALRELGPAVLIYQAQEDGPAAQAGILSGDVVLGIGGRALSGDLRAGPVSALIVLLQGLEARLRFEGMSLSRIGTALEGQHTLQGFRPGESVEFQVLRKGAFRRVEVHLRRQGLFTWKGLFLGLAVIGLAYLGLLSSKLSVHLASAHPFPYRQFVLTVLFFVVLGAAMESNPGGSALTLSRHLLATAVLVVVLPAAFPSQPRLRRPRVLLLIPIALGITYFLWFWHELNPIGEDRGYFSISGIRAKLFGVGEPFLSAETAVPVATVLVLMFALLYLASFWRRLIAPMSPRHPAQRDLCRAAEQAAAEELEASLNREVGTTTTGYYAARFLRLIRRLNRDPADAALERERRNILDEDEARAANALNPVEWCEIALPVLGFLGTVIGLARSLADVQSLSQAGATASVSELLATILSAFEGVGYAFDTTFLGLASMLIVAAVHTAVRRSAFHRLTEAGAVLDVAIGHWVSASPARDLEKATEDRAKLRGMAEDVLLFHPSPFVRQVREILLRPSVMFEKLTPPPDQELQAFLEKRAGDGWQYTALGLSRTSGTGLLLATNGGGDRWLARLDLDAAGRVDQELKNPSTTHLLGPRWPKIEAIFPAGQGDGLTVRTDAGMLFSASLNGSDLQAVTLPKGAENQEVSSILRMKMDQQDILVLCTQHHEGCELIGVRAGDTDAWRLGILGGQLESESELVVGDEASGMIFRMGRKTRQGRPWIIQRLRLPARVGVETHTLKTLDLRMTSPESAIWPHESRPTRLLALGESEVVVVAEPGLFHWSFNRSFRRLDDDLPGGIPILLVRGADRWVAAIHGGQLRMWQVRASGSLVPYQGEVSGYPVSALTDGDGDRIQATADGRLLLGLTGENTLATWRFPQLALDS